MMTRFSVNKVYGSLKMKCYISFSSYPIEFANNGFNEVNEREEFELKGPLHSIFHFFSTILAVTMKLEVLKQFFHSFLPYFLLKNRII